MGVIMNQNLIGFMRDMAENIYYELDNQGVLVDGAEQEDVLTSIMFGMKDTL